MSITAPIAMFGWIPLVLALFYALPARRAVICSYIGAWLFLPMTSYEVSFLPGYDKTFAATVAVILGVLIFDFDRIASFRFRWPDSIAIAFCTAPMFSMLTNGVGIWAGLSEMSEFFLAWTGIYFIGRMYFTDLDALRELALGIVIGGLIYIPLCLIEVRLSPQLHRWVYGYHQHDFSQTQRMGGYRPMVFMQHGLMVAAWMMAATVIAFWLWITGSVRRVLGMPMWVAFFALLVTLILCKSVGAWAIAAAGIAVLSVCYFARSHWPVMVYAALPVLYMVVSLSGVIPYNTLYEISESLFGEDRASSLQFRFESEDAIIGHALNSPLFGWSDRYWRYSEYGDDLVRATDQLWVIYTSQLGLFGWTLMTGLFCIPPIILLSRMSARCVTHPKAAPIVVLTLMAGMFLTDCLFNAMVNPVFVLAIGAVASMPPVKLAARRSAPAQSRQRRAGPARQSHRSMPPRPT